MTDDGEAQTAPIEEDLIEGPPIPVERLPWIPAPLRDEMVAIRVSAIAMVPLSVEARRRVLSYLVDVFDLEQTEHDPGPH